MPGVSEKSLIKLGGWPLGIDNLSEEHALTRDQDGNVVALRFADNVDITMEGDPSSRSGYVQLAEDHFHSLFCAPGWPFGLCVRNGALCTVDDTGATTQLRTGMAPWDELTYAALTDRILWSSPQRNGIVTLDGELLPFGVPTPSVPNVTATAGGGMDAGKYQVTLTWQRATGEEGGADEGVDVDVPAGGGISITGIPAAPDASIARTNIYVTPANGDVFYRAAPLPANATSATIGVHTSTKKLETQFLEPIPPANILRIFNARTLFAIGGTFGWSAPVRPALTHLTENTIGRFGGDITMVEPLDQADSGGVYVAAKGRTFWLAGNDPKDWQLRLVHAYGAIPGSSVIVSGSVFPQFETAAPVAYWYDSDGFPCVGLPGGSVHRLTADRFCAGVTDSAASVLRERGGERHIITAMRGKPRSNIALGDAMDTTLIRNGRPV